MPAVCAWPKQLELIAARHGGIKLPPDWSHESRKHLVRNVPPVDGLYPIYTHESCVCNEIIAITNRVLGVVPDPTKEGVNNLRKAMRILKRSAKPCSPITGQEFVDSFKDGRRRKIYAQALSELRSDGVVEATDGRIRAFIKMEKFNMLDKVNPDPRVIQYRSPKYNCMLGRYLRACEHQLYKLKGPLGYRVIAKGLNQVDRAKLLQKKLNAFEHPVVFSIDGSRWDKHIHPDILNLEHSYYLKCFGNDPFLKWLLWYQQNNICSTKNGLKYKVAANRMSGDLNTALGNCLLMVTMVYAAMKSLHIKYWDVLDDGDDCLIIVEKSQERLLLDGLANEFLTYGQEIKLENRAEDIQDVKFCQCQVVRVGGQPRFVRNWKKVLSGASSGFHNWNDLNKVYGMFTAIGQCELSINVGVPILEAFARACIRIGRGKQPPADFYRYEYGQHNFESMTTFRNPVVGFDERVSFERAFGVSPDDQIAIENALDRWDVLVDEFVDVDVEIDHRWEPNIDPRLTNLVETVCNHQLGLAA